MITIKNETLRKQRNFWNHCLFHPTDAVEDPWGKRIFDKMAADKAIKTVRIYSMFEDIVYLGENGEICYDWRVSDLRLDYLLEKGFDLLIAYGGMPDCIADSTAHQHTAAKGKTRYKGKMWNTSPPKDYALWEEICYQYTKHNVERYGADVVEKWYCHCHNEPDTRFFMANLPSTEDGEDQEIRVREYCKLYAAFERGVRRVSDKIKIGGPALAHRLFFLDKILTYVQENDLKLDYIAVHNYGGRPVGIDPAECRLNVEFNLRKHRHYMEVLRRHGLENIEVIADEWGAKTHGFFNREECPMLMFRETEVFAAYYAKLICKMIELDPNVSKMLICLSGQHEMVEDFSGFRNFFTLNFISKPIYNAYCLAAKLGEDLLLAACGNENVALVPTKCDDGSYAVLLSYSSEYFEEDLPEIMETVSFDEDITGKTVTVWCIDKQTTNPYRLYQKMGVETPNEEQIKLLREEGNMKPQQSFVAKAGDEISLCLTANCTYLVTVV